MAFEFRMPDIGEGLTEGEVTKWLVAAGDTVTEDQPIVEVMTDKATVEIPSPRAGRIAELRAKEGQVVPVGSVILVIEEAGAPARAAAPAAAPVPVRTPPPTATPGGGRPARGPVRAAPATRRLAREKGIDLSAVAGSGEEGRVTRQDVVALVERAPAGAPRPVASLPAAPDPSAAQSAAPAAADAGEKRIPVRGLRRRISEQMVRSKRTIPHFTFVDEVDMTEVVRWREEAKGFAAERGVKLSYLPFVVKAVCRALREFPTVNASLDDERQEIVLHGGIHIGIATATDEGLTVPVVRDADRLSVLAIGAEVQRLSEAARARTIGVGDLKGSTFTITSTGSHGGVLATPIINWPEVAILGVHRIRERPAVREGAICIRSMANLSISLDHRVVDGAVGAAFLGRVISLLESPARLFLESA